jgi:CheY-like chemotaxis protein
VRRANNPTERTATALPASAPTLRILVVDADDEARALYRRSFVGCEVIEAADGREALLKAFSRPLALVITELRLPRLDGYTVCELLRYDRATTDVPILVVTSETRPADLNRARQAGATAVLSKPIPDILREMRRLVADVNGRGRPAAPRSSMRRALAKTGTA